MDVDAARADVAEGMTSADQVPARESACGKRVAVRERRVQGNCGAWWRVWRVISVAAALRGA